MMMKNIFMRPVFLLALAALTILSGCLEDEDIVFPDPKANFSFEPQTPAPGDAVTLLNGSVNASTYKWTVEQGKITDESRTEIGFAEEEDFQYVFESVGNYTVTLLAINKQGATDEISKEVVVAWPELTTEFTIVSTIVNVYEDVEFTNTSLNAVSYEWNFGDGSAISTDKNPVHAYNTAGTFTVTLTAVGFDGGNKSYSTDITVKETGPVVDFSMDKTRVNLGESISFTNATKGNVTTLEWSFEGGNPASSSDENPTVTYNSSGVYKVSLSATNTAGTNIKEAYVEVVDPAYTGSSSQPFVRDAWAIESVSSEETAYGNPVTNILDGDINTIWHSRWSEEPYGPLPQNFVIDMGQMNAVTGFLFTQRQYNGRAGSINVNAKDITIEGSYDNKNWTKLQDFVLEQEGQGTVFGEQVLTLDQVSHMKYFRITFNTAYNSSYVACAEIGAY